MRQANASPPSRGSQAAAGPLIVAAPNAFKGAMAAADAAAAILSGAAEAHPDALTLAVPMADGGDGTSRVLARALGGQDGSALVPGPWGPGRRARFALLPEGTLAVDLAAASGLGRLTPSPRAAATASTAGTGVLLRAALRRGPARRIWLALGGSATSDGGTGLLTALGARLLDASGAELPPGGAALAHLDRIDLSGLAWLTGLPWVLLVDVGNPLLGPSGAARVFGPQKGADPATVAALEAGLGRLADVLESATGRRLRDRPGAGAAGGAGFGLAAALGAELRPGAEAVASAVGLPGHLAGATLCLTGEGALDAQTAMGKAPWAVAGHAARAGVPVVALAGVLGAGWEGLLTPRGPFTAAFPLAPGPRSRTRALLETGADLRRTAAAVVRLYRAGGAPARPAR